MTVKMRFKNEQADDLGLLLEPEGMYVPLRAGAAVMVEAECDPDETIEIVVEKDGLRSLSVYSQKRKAWSEVVP
jgi:hypothetical protein